MRKLVLGMLCALLAMPAFGQTTLNGAGATFPNPMYSKWFSEYAKLHSDVQINYQPIGSGGGIRQVTAGTVDFGASDMPMTDKQLSDSKVKILNIPTVLGAVVARVPAVTEFDQDPTEVISTGDWVKVDADKGLVEITKK